MGFNLALDLTLSWIQALHDFWPAASLYSQRTSQPADKLGASVVSRPLTLGGPRGCHDHAGMTTCAVCKRLKSGNLQLFPQSLRSRVCDRRIRPTTSTVCRFFRRETRFDVFCWCIFSQLPHHTFWSNKQTASKISTSPPTRGINSAAHPTNPCSGLTLLMTKGSKVSLDNNV